MNELDKISEKILKQVVKNDCSLTPEKFNNLGLFKKYSKKEISECLNNLSSLDFIYLDKKENLLCSNFKSRQYLLIKRKKILKTIIINIIVPFFIAFFTAYITAKFTTNKEVIVLVNTINNV